MSLLRIRDETKNTNRSFSEITLPRDGHVAVWEINDFAASLEIKLANDSSSELR
jgi:hypothetical protein